jgi:uncharacterized protein DUF1565
MKTFAYTRIPFILLAVLALAACPKDKHHHDDPPPVTTPPPSPIFYVNAGTGLDTNPGTQASPFKTITHALTVATTSGSTVNVAPGLYDVVNNGETFPITVPAGVLLIGDETNKGAGTPTATSIVGKGTPPAGFNATTVTVIPGTGSTVAGFTITSDTNSFGHDSLLLANSTVTVRNNTVTGATRYGVEVDATTNHVISGNRIVNNGGSGLGFVKGGVGSKVQSNVISGNPFGVEYDVDGGDLGGGSAGSTGGNVLSCNSFNDLIVGTPTAISISAKNNLWDHTNPTLGCDFSGSGSGIDICDVSAAPATITTTGSAQTVNPAPCP